MREDVDAAQRETVSNKPSLSETDFYCPQCRKPVREPLVCGDCLSLICRDCGTPLERADDLGIG
jgi:hypothetical protein